MAGNWWEAAPLVEASPGASGANWRDAFPEVRQDGGVGASVPELAALTPEPRGNIRSEFRTPDGRATAPGTTAEDAARIPPGMVYDPRTGGYVDAALKAERMGLGLGAMATALAGMPFVGEYVDEEMGRFDSRMSGRSPEIAQEIARQSRSQFAEARPVLAPAIEVGSGIVGSLPFVTGAAGAVPKAASTLQKAIMGAGAGALAAGTEGAIQGYGAGTTPESRLDKAFEYGRLGILLGGVLGGAASPASEAIKAGWSRLKVPDIKVIARELGISEPAARGVHRALRQEDPNEALRRIRLIGKEGMLADAGEITGGVLDTAIQSGDSGLRIAREAVEGRSARLQPSLTKVMDETLGGAPEGVRSMGRDIASRTAPAREAAYRAAYGTKIDYTGGAGRKVEEVFSRIPAPVMQDALREANEELLSNPDLRALGAEQIMASIADDGSVTFRELPNVMQLDQLKRALDTIAAKETDDFGRPTARGLRYQRLAREVREATIDATGGTGGTYAKAVALGGDKIAEDNALKLGSRFFSGASLEDVQEWARGKPSVEAREAAARGVRSEMERIMARVTAVASDPNVDAREANEIAKKLTSRETRAKLALILGRQNADKLIGEIDRSMTALQLRARVARNSATYGRMATAEAIKAEGQPGVLRQVIGELGSPLEAARPLSRAIAGTDPKAMTEYHRQLFDEITQALTQIKGRDAERALQVINRAMQGQKITDAQADFVARVTVAPMFTGAYQAGMQIPAMQ